MSSWDGRDMFNMEMVCVGFVFLVMATSSCVRLRVHTTKGRSRRELYLSGFFVTFLDDVYMRMKKYNNLTQAVHKRSSQTPRLAMSAMLHKGRERAKLEY